MSVPLAFRDVPAATLVLADDAEAEPRRRWSRGGPALVEHAVASLFTMVVAWPFLRPNGFVNGFDTVAYSGPNLEVTLDAWRHGRLPLWNGRIFGGVTNVGNPAAGALYPLKLLALPFDVSRGLAVLVVVHLLILANGMVALLSWRLRLRPPAATIGAVVLLGSGLVMIKVLQFEQLLVLAWIPLLLALLHWILTAARPLGPAIATAVVTALVLIAGHPQTVYITAPLVIGVAIAFAADTGTWRRLGIVTAAGLVGVLLAAPQLLAEVAATGDSALSGARPISIVDSPVFRLEGDDALRALLGNPLSTFPDADAGTYEALSFVGAAAAVLAVIGIVDGVRRRRRRVLTVVLACMGAVGVVAALGPQTWMYRVAYDHVPLFDQARVPARWLTITVLAIAVLAAMGADALIGRRIDRLVIAVLGASTAFVALLALTEVETTPGRRVVVLWLVAGGLIVASAAIPTTGRRGLAVAAVVVPVAIVMAELGLSSRDAVAGRGPSDASVEHYAGNVVKFLDGQPGRSVALTYDQLDDPAYLVASLRPNANALFAVPSLDGYDGGVQVTQRWADTMSALASDAFDPESTLRTQIAVPVDAGLLGRLGVRWVVIDTRTGDPASMVPGFRGPVATDGTIEAFENPAWRGDAVAWFTTQSAPDAKAASRLLATGGVAPNATVLIGAEPGPTCSGACTPVGLPVDRSRPERATTTVDLPRDAVVTLDEQADAGWSATVDGHAASTVVADGLYVGVHVPAGRHDVVFSYQPRGWRTGVMLALVGVALLVAAAAAVAVQGRRAMVRSTSGASRFRRTRSPIDE